MKKYWVSLKNHWQSQLEYRVDIIIYTLVNWLNPLVGLTIWLAISSTGIELNYQTSELIFYFLITMFVVTFTQCWASWFLAEEINRGNYSKYLVKPYSAYSDYLLRTLSQKPLRIIYTLTVIILACLFFIPDYQYNFSILKIGLFLLSLFMAFYITFTLDFVIGMTAVWSHDIDFVRGANDLFTALFAGRFIPLIFLPAVFLQIAQFLPYRYMISFPVEIMVGQLNSDQLLFGFVIQITWVLALGFLYFRLLKKVNSSYQAFG